MVMPGLINLDFADIRTVMSEMGKAMMGTGEAEGENRAVAAAEAAISNPLLDDVSMKGARGVLINITGGFDMTLFEVDEAANRIRDEVDPEANIIFGSTFDRELEGRVRISVVATGIEAEAMAQPRPSLTLVAKGGRMLNAPFVAEAQTIQPAPQPMVMQGRDMRVQEYAAPVHAGLHRAGRGELAAGAADVCPAANAAGPATAHAAPGAGRSAGAATGLRAARAGGSAGAAAAHGSTAAAADGGIAVCRSATRAAAADAGRSARRRSRHLR